MTTIKRYFNWRKKKKRIERQIMILETWIALFEYSCTVHLDHYEILTRKKKKLSLLKEQLNQLKK